MSETVTTEMLRAEMFALEGRMDRIGQQMDHLLSEARALNAETVAFNTALRAKLAAREAAAKAGRMDA